MRATKDLIILMSGNYMISLSLSSQTQKLDWGNTLKVHLILAGHCINNVLIRNSLTLGGIFSPEVNPW